MAAGVAEIVRALEFAAVRAFLIGLDAQRVMAAAHAAAGRGRFPLGDSHVGTLFHKLIC
jgi:predicted HAD superfamily Cof-like phosphohydrolase